jgi:hypothetical protein
MESAAPADLVPRLPKGVSPAEFADARPAVQDLIIAKASVVSINDFTASQLPPPLPDVVVSLPRGVTSDDFAGASTQVRHIIKAASTVSKKRERSEDLGSLLARSAEQLERRVLSSDRGGSLQGALVAAVSHDNVRGSVVAAKQPARSDRDAVRAAVVAVVFSRAYQGGGSLLRCSSLKTKKDIDSAIVTATAIAREIEGVRLKRQRFHDDSLLGVLTHFTRDALVHTLEQSAEQEQHFQTLKPASRQALTTVLLESGLSERKERYKSDACAYNALTAGEALFALARREYALSETLLALTTALSSPATQMTVNHSLKMNTAALESLTALCDQMRADSGIERKSSDGEHGDDDDDGQ